MQKCKSSIAGSKINCEVCKKTFAKKIYLNKHFKKFHSVRVESTKVKPKFNCCKAECNEKLTNVKELRRHLMNPGGHNIRPEIEEHEFNDIDGK